MNVEIFRPMGIFVITSGENPDQQNKHAVLSMSAGRVLTTLEGKASESVVAFEIHGERVSVHLPFKTVEGNRGLVQWDNWSLSLTLYSKWIAGLSLDQKEAMIGEVLHWEEGVQQEIYAQSEVYGEVNEEAQSYDLEKLKAS